MEIAVQGPLSIKKAHLEELLRLYKDFMTKEIGCFCRVYSGKVVH